MPKTVIVTDQLKWIRSARSEKSLRGLNVDKVLVIISKDFKMSDKVKMNLNLAVVRSGGTVEYIYTD